MAKQLNELLDRLVAIKLLLSNEEEEIMEFRKEHGEVTPFVLAARQMSAYRSTIGNTFCVADLHPLLQTVLSIYTNLVDTVNPVQLPSAFKSSLLFELLNHAAEINDQIQKLADGFDSNYLTLLQDAIDAVCGYGTSQRLGF